MTNPSPAFSPAPAAAFDCEAQIRELVHESQSHPAVNHPWLTTMARAAFSDPVGALKQFAIQYHGYTSWFPHYLRSVIRRLDREDHRLLLNRNLEEERGQLDEDDLTALRQIGIDPNDILGIPHPVLFRRFCTAMGITDRQLAQPGPQAVRWRTRFLRFLESATPAQAVGALGLGTEHIVRPVYEHILAGIRRIGILDREDYVFFELHCLVDDQHQEDLLTVAKELVLGQEGIEELRSGMETALELRCDFWDHLYDATTSLQRKTSA